MTTTQTARPAQPPEVRPRDPLRAARYVLPTSIVYGKGVLDQLPQLLAELGVAYPLIVTDRGLASSAVLKQVRETLLVASVRHEVFCDVESDPSTTTVDQIALQLRELVSDGVIGLGGGSAMDAAKAAAAAATSGLSAIQLTGPDRVPCDPLPIIAIPTTAGTGSEVTRFAVLTDLDAGAKASVASFRVMPKFALLDPALTVSLPPSLTASTGLDALAHAIESYGSVWNNPISEGMALHAISLTGQYLRTAAAEPGDLIARGGMLAAACIAELAANTTRLGLAHAVAVPLGATHHIPHGVGVAMMLGPMCAFNEEADHERYERVAAAFGVSGGRSVSEIVFQLCADLGLRSRLRDFGVQAEDYGQNHWASYEERQRARQSAFGRTSRAAGKLLARAQ